MLSLHWDQADLNSGLKGFLCHTQEIHWPTLTLFMGALDWSLSKHWTVWRQECTMQTLKGHLLVDGGHCTLLPLIRPCPFAKSSIHPDYSNNEYRSVDTPLTCISVVFVSILFCVNSPPTLSSSRNDNGISLKARKVFHYLTFASINQIDWQCN